MSHDDFISDLPAYIRGEMPDSRAQEMETHLSGCSSCAKVAAQTQRTIRLLKAAPLEHSAPEHLEDHVMSLIELDRDTVDDKVEVSARGRRRGTRPGSRWARVAPVLAPALAAAAIALGIVGFVWQHRATDMGWEAGQSQKVVSVQNEIAPNAEATARLIEHEGENYRLIMQFDHLPSTDPEHHYEVWLSGDEGWISAGSFRVSSPLQIPAFSGQVAVDPVEYPRLWVTLEPDDGNPKRTGTTILDADLSS